MPGQQPHPARPRWYLIPARILLITFLLTLLSFALGLLGGIVGIVIVARIHGIHPNLTFAYRQVALPVAAVVASVALIATTVLEIRAYRQTKILAGVARASR
ncbi:MAG TPA: hypothetical protein VEI26_15580 [Terriglobales bacterium]|nr:hypothetical protein [Terriglobales bacterium]